MKINSVRHYRNGDGRGLAEQVAREVKGMMLAEAFVTAKALGLPIRVNKSDGVPRQGYAEDTRVKVLVDVVHGFVTKAWAA